MNAVVERLHIAFELSESGCEIMLQNLRRRHPGETEDQIEVRFGEWLRTSGGEHPGKPYTFRFSP